MSDRVVARHRRRPRDRPRDRRDVPRGRRRRRDLRPDRAGRRSRRPTAAPRSFVAADVRDPDAVDARRRRRPSTGPGASTCWSTTRAARRRPTPATASPQFSRAIIELNLLAPLVCAQQANAVMQAQADGGSIVNIASVSGAAAVTRAAAAYGAAKAGLLNLTQTLAVECAPKVRVNAVTRGPDPHRAGAPPLRRRGGHRRGRRHRAARPHGHARRHRRRVPLPRVAARRLRVAAPTSSCTAAASGPRTSTPPSTTDPRLDARQRAARLTSDTGVMDPNAMTARTRSRCSPATRSAAPARSSAPTPASRRARRSSTSSSTSPTRPTLAAGTARPRRRGAARRRARARRDRDRRLPRPTATFRSWDVVEGVRPTLLVRRGDARDLHHQGAPRVRRRARPARHHRRRQRADRPVAGRRVRLRRRGRPPHRALHLVPPRPTRRTTATPGRSKG